MISNKNDMQYGEIFTVNNYEEVQQRLPIPPQPHKIDVPNNKMMGKDTKMGVNLFKL